MLTERKLKYMCVGALSLTSAAILYHYIFNQPPPQNPKQAYQTTELPLRTNHSNYSQFYFDKELELKQIVQGIQNRLPSVEEVHLLSPLIAIDQYLKYTKEIRKRRRLIRKINENQYITIIRHYEIEIKELLERAKEELLQEFQISLDDFEKMQRAYSMFDDLQQIKKRSTQILTQKAFNRQKLRRIPQDKLRKIIDQQVLFINNKLYSRLKAKLQQQDLEILPEESFKIITALCDDIIFEKYGYERQEIEKQITVSNLLTPELLKCRQHLFADLVAFNLDSVDSDSQIEDQPINKSQTKTMVEIDDFSLNQ